MRISKKIFGVSFIVFSLALGSCQKCKLKGEVVINEPFDNYGEWLLYSGYSENDEYYTRIEDGVLKLKTDQKFQSCQRATYYINDDLADINGFEACIRLKTIQLPQKVDLHFLLKIGKFQVHATVEKKSVKNNSLIFRVDDKGISSNHKGALFGGLGNELETDEFEENFVQISLCPESEEDSSGQLYVEIDELKLTVL